ncbi:glycerophosphodiester phosphodiesterase family protein [Catenovulum sp. 2E275]|uniref:glycerophosphodiester phosphodiesterase n=1 Tax=Catenovulum sp. 2E275 TaxID=2980497 RepID=UPI0021D02A5D|nr:glycerophosphodiester phosphodiesterase family protein [Catenovulum sp. 2E275]MCU4674840.1 glycerophosphodiester phosphodiesterase family protein [Catenovulum sp. 2E275]
MKIIAHRGASGIAPENTLAAFRLALESGVDGIELDIQMVDGTAVVLHDRWLQKTTNGLGLTQQINLNYLQSLDAGGGQRVPTLKEVFTLINGACLINIELKAPDCELAVLADIDYALKQLNFKQDQFIISSFNHFSLRKINQLVPWLKLGALTANLPLEYAAFASQLNAFSVNACIDFIDQAFVDDAHQRGLEVWVYTVNQIEDIQAMLDLGVDAIFTDYPSRALQYIQ